MPWDASLSRFGVFPDIMPRWYAPMFQTPMSSPMMTTMIGFLPPGWATFALAAASNRALSASTQQEPSAGWQAAGAAVVASVAGAGSARDDDSRRPEATAHPPSPPTTSMSRGTSFELRSMTYLLG